MQKERILVIDDEPTLLEACEETLSYHGYDVHLTANARDGVESVRQETFDLVLVDLRMPDTDGLQILREIKSIDENLMMIMITGFPTIATAVEAVREGAFDYLPKPFSPDQLLIVVERALSQKRLTEENLRLRKTLGFRQGFEGMVGKSRAIEQVMDLVEKVAESDTSVVIEGETGTGKELIARSLHRNSPRRDGPFLPINCGALPEQLLESELFGHERGAFTGAHTRKPGLLETAEGGTVFLDEISALSSSLQVKLLRVLQERQVRRVGGQELIDIDMRVVFGHERRSGADGGQRPLPGRPVLPAQRYYHLLAPFAGAGGRCSPSGSAYSQRAEQGLCKACPGHFERGAGSAAELRLAGECAGAAKCDRTGFHAHRF